MTYCCRGHSHAAHADVFGGFWAHFASHPYVCTHFLLLALFMPALGLQAGLVRALRLACVQPLVNPILRVLSRLKDRTVLSPCHQHVRQHYCVPGCCVKRGCFGCRTTLMSHPCTGLWCGSATLQLYPRVCPSLKQHMCAKLAAWHCAAAALCAIVGHRCRCKCFDSILQQLSAAMPCCHPLCRAPRFL